MLKAEMGIDVDMSCAISGGILGQCEERLKSGIMMEAAIVMAVPGDEACPVQRMGAASMALLMLMGSERELEG